MLDSIRHGLASLDITQLAAEDALVLNELLERREALQARLTQDEQPRLR